MLQSWVSECDFYIGGSTLLCQFIESITFARCAFIFALWNIALGRYLDKRRNIYEMTVDLKYIYIANFRAIERTRKLASLAIIISVQYIIHIPNIGYFR